MSSLADLPDLIGFFSYSREDDADSFGALSALRTRVQGELRGQLGRTAKTFRLWQDKEAIPSGSLWESEIKNAVGQSVFFIPIITPTVVASPYCRVELELFLAREAELGRDDLVFPILYIDVPSLEDGARRQNDPVLSLIGRRQYVDWREFRYLDVASTEVRREVGRFCTHIRDALRHPWISPEERKQQEQEVVRQQAEQRRRAQAEVDRRAEADARQRAADEERRRAAEAQAQQKADAQQKAAAETKRRLEEERRRSEAEEERTRLQPPVAQGAVDAEPQSGEARQPDKPTNGIAASAVAQFDGIAKDLAGLFAFLLIVRVVGAAVFFLQGVTEYITNMALIWCAAAVATVAVLMGLRLSVQPQWARSGAPAVCLLGSLLDLFNLYIVVWNLFLRGGVNPRWIPSLIALGGASGLALATSMIGLGYMYRTKRQPRPR
jgi:TIR domain-containing protein